MFSWKSFFLTAAVCSTLFAQSSIEGEITGKIVLKDKEGKAFEITKDSKPTIELISIGTLDKLVLKNQYQIRISLDQKQEAIFDMTQEFNTSKNKDIAGRLELVGRKDENKQDFHLQCYIKKDVKVTTPAAKYEKTSVACVKTSGCKSYALNSDKKFKLSETSICSGKKEIDKSVEAIDFEEKITCVLVDSLSSEKVTNQVKLVTKKTTKEIDYKDSTNECK